MSSVFSLQLLYTELMRFLSKLLLVISIVFSFVILLVSITARFQLLNSSFWIKSLRTADVYTELEPVLTRESKRIFIEEGARSDEIEEVAKIFQKNEIQNLVEKNIVHVLDFVNGKSQNPVVYFPLAQVPDDIKANLELTSDEIPVRKLISTFGKSSTPVGEEFFVQMRTIGTYLTISFFIALVTILINIFLLYKLEFKGARMTALGVSFVLSGLFSIAIAYLIGIYAESTAQSLLVPENELVQIALGTTIIPISENITQLWTIISVATIAVGIILMFTRRPGQTVSQGIPLR